MGPRVLVGLCLLLLLLSACTQRVAKVYPDQLARHAAALVTAGHARVPDDRGDPVEVDADEVIEAEVQDGNLSRPLRLSIRELVAGCVDHPGGPGCIAATVAPRPIPLRSKVAFSGTKLATSLTFVAIGGGLAGCIAACAGGGELGTGLAVSGLTMVGLFGFAFVVFSFVN